MAAELPPQIKRAIEAFDSECRSKLAALYAQVKFNEDQIETFQLNAGPMTSDRVASFKAFLEQELAKRFTAPGSAPSRTGVGKSGQSALPFPKRAKTQHTASLANAVGAALGMSGAGVPKPIEVVTPDPKRLKEARGDVVEELPTPERQQKQMKISVKASVNDALPVKASAVVDAADAAGAGKVPIDLLGDRKLWSGGRHGVYAWMDESLEDRSAARDARLAEAEEGLVAAMKARHPQAEDLVVGQIGMPSQAEVVIVGRIVCEGLEGRLNERSMLLEGSRGGGRNVRVQLNVACCPELVAFPGQLVAVLGRSGSATNTFHARDFVPGFRVAPPPPVVAPGCSRLLHTLVLAGPFCRRDDLDYSPLAGALDHAAQAAPQVVLMLGPFVDAANKGVVAGEPVLPGSKADDVCSIEEVYTQHVFPMLRQSLLRLRNASPSTEVLILPSLDEALCFHPMPQPPLDASLGPSLGELGSDMLRKMGAKLLPNPAHLNIEGLRLTVTSTDALSPVLRSGLVLRPEDRRIERALRVLLQQRTLFPVVPRDPANISENRAAALDFPGGELPDVLVFPSATGTASGQFVDGRLVVNPGSVCRPAALGTFAEIWLTPAPAAEAGAPADSGSLLRRARVDIKSFSE
mmetsp:Transcript_81001/g.234865  ORF Transcript_81001/g.234865 Transcript_81001/m.234865 type:complete len:635 (+) Transcript_81001:82-1986(+)